MTRWISFSSVGFEHLLLLISHRRTKLNPGDGETHRLLYDLPADARVLRLAGRRDWPSPPPRVIFTVSTFISTVDSYQYCSKPVVEWNKLHLKHHLPVWGLWPESETESFQVEPKTRISQKVPESSNLFTVAIGDLIRSKLMEWNPYGGTNGWPWHQRDVERLEIVHREKWFSCTIVVVLVESESKCCHKPWYDSIIFRSARRWQEAGNNVAWTLNQNTQWETWLDFIPQNYSFETNWTWDTDSERCRLAERNLQ